MIYAQIVKKKYLRLELFFIEKSSQVIYTKFNYFI